MTTEEFFADVDWPQLRDQKLMLLEHVEDDSLLYGLVTFIDSIQDHAVDVLGVPAQDVFLLEED